ncbi:MAG: glycosyltransferase [Anaerolineae bacterium]|nr:glycosyltransferase [Anaerolineae bacterium]MDW8071794.1 glycosyltransferase [Anaerolineae bacterium]
MKVSVIATVLNEGASLQRLLDSLAAQTRMPDEVIIVDGGSRDATLSILQAAVQAGRLPLRVLVEPGANISRGRNVAVAASSGEVIASTDAGVRLAPEWLAALVAPFERTSPPQVVSGVFVPDVETTFEIAMAATVLPTLAEIKPERFLPSSRSVAFTRRAWEAVGGYPEWLDYCEDLVFDLRLRQRFHPFGFAPGAVAYFRPRSRLGSFFRQYYLYARGDGKADLWRKRHLVRYLTYLVALPLLLWLGWWVSPWWWLALIAGAAAHLYVPYRRLWPWLRTLPWRERLIAVGWVPVIRVTGDVAKMLGYPVGLLWRWKRLRHHPELDWRRPSP